MTPHAERLPDESLELPVDELLRRGRPHSPYGEQVIDDLTPAEADAFLDAILRSSRPAATTGTHEFGPRGSGSH